MLSKNIQICKNRKQKDRQGSNLLKFHDKKYDL